MWICGATPAFPPVKIRHSLRPVPRRFLIAPDKFKGSLSAPEAAAAGWQRMEALLHVLRSSS